MRKYSVIVFVAIALSAGGAALALLQNNGNNLFYDTDLNITWYNPSITDMNWNQAMAWADSLTIGNFTNWRLPSAKVIGSELEHLYFTELGNNGSGLTKTGPFLNLQPVNYWTNTTRQNFNGNAYAYSFKRGLEGFADKNLIDGFSPIAIHPGDVHTVSDAPIPITIFLFVSGITGLVVMKKESFGRRVIEYK